MKGDFTRDTFDPAKHFTRVLMQQGRVQLDADWNEQVSVLLHYLQTLAEDLIGPYGGPADILKDPSQPATASNIAQKKCGFDIGFVSSGDPLPDLSIGEGHYYAGGILCENKTWHDSKGKQRPTYYTQPDYPRDPKKNLLPTGNFLVYLDVWERLITHCEDGSIREVALGGPDTAARAKVVWQVKLAENLTDLPSGVSTGETWDAKVKVPWATWVEKWQPTNRGLLKAKAKEDTSQNIDACAVPPGVQYRGKENQLYRVEVHRGGYKWDGEESGKAAATFKWSRENGSVIFPIRQMDGKLVHLDHLGRDDRQSLKVDDWVEVVDDAIALQVEPNKPGLLAQVAEIDPLDMTVTLTTPNDETVALPTYAENASCHPLLRRWDHIQREATEADEPQPAPDGALLIEEKKWLMLEDRIQIWFDSPETVQQQYRTGDYWLIPARTATGDVEWPKETDDQGLPKRDKDGWILKPMPPHGVEHHYAPLAVVVGTTVNDARHKFSPAP